MKIAVAGTGYVGLSNAILLSQHNEVFATDIIQAKVDLINSKKSPIDDKEIEEYLANKNSTLRPQQTQNLPIMTLTLSSSQLQQTTTRKKTTLTHLLLKRF